MSKRRKQKFISLNFKMTIVVLIGIALALGMYLFCSWFTGYVTQIRYLSDEAVSQNVGEAYDSYRFQSAYQVDQGSGLHLFFRLR